MKESEMLEVKETVKTAIANFHSLISQINSQIQPILKDLHTEVGQLYKINTLLENALVEANSLNTMFIDLDISVHALNRLKAIGVNTIADYLAKSESEIIDAPGIGNGVSILFKEYPSLSLRVPQPFVVNNPMYLIRNCFTYL